MADFGYVAGMGSGTNTVVAATLVGQIASRYQNNTGGYIAVDTIDLLNVHTGGSSGPVQLALYEDVSGVPGNLLGASATLTTIAAGNNSFTVSPAIILASGKWVWVAIRADWIGGLACDGAIASRAAEQFPQFGRDAFASVWPSGYGPVDLILPVRVRGSVPGSTPATTPRLTLIYADGMAEGVPTGRAALVFAEPLAEGSPNVRGAYFFSEPLTEGHPNVRVALSFAEILQDVLEDGEMVTDTFPTLRGLSWSVHKKPNFNTQVRRATSNRTVRNSLTPYPYWQFELTYEYLPNDPGRPNPTYGTTDLNTLMGFFLQQHGRDGLWLFRDVTDYQVTAGNCARYPTGVTGGDGVTTEFWLARQMGPFLEPIGQVDDVHGYTVYKNGAPQVLGTDYTFNAPNRITFASAPAIGATITWTGWFWFVCSFSDDVSDYENFADKLWSLGQLDFESNIQ